MGSFRGAGLGMRMRAERSLRGRSGRAAESDLTRRKAKLKKVWPEIWALVAPRKGLILAGLVLMAINSPG
jgi:hypothetical protein